MSLPTFPQFDIEVDVNSLATKWSKYVERFKYYMIAFEIKESRKRVLLLHSVGPTVQDIFMSLKVPNAREERKEFDLALEALDGYFKPKRNVEYEIYQRH